MGARAWWVTGAVAALAAAGLACGPSFQAIYESDARFEHCYAVDENPSVATAQKAACWNDWLKHYTYGQTRDRVAYAHARSRAMSTMSELPTDEALMNAAPGEVPKSGGITAPTPTNAFAPPPKTLDSGDGGTEAGAASGAWMSNVPTANGASGFADAGGSGGDTSSGVLRPPGADCTDDCTRVWQRCKSDCDAGVTGCKRCDLGYKGCLRGCAAK